MEKKKKFSPEPVPCDELYLDMSVASSTECTGLGTILPQEEWEAESFRHIYDIPLQSGEPKGKK